MMQKMIINLFLVLMILCPTWMAMAQSDCSLPPRLVVGETAQVSEGQSNNVRENPSRDATRLGVLPSATVLDVLEGPTCADGLQWWRVQYGNLIGWTVEGSDGEYWLLPVTVEPPLVLSTTVITAENASQLQPNRTLNCDTGPDSSVLIALGSHVVAMNCGAYNIKETNLSLHDQLLRDHLGIIDLETSQHILTLSGEGDDVYPIAFLPDGHLLWFSQEESNFPFTLHLSDITTGEEINRTEIDYGQSAGHLFFHPIFYANGTRFALFYLDDGEYVLHRWDATSLTLLQEQVFEKPETLVDDSVAVTFAIAPDGERFAINYRVKEGEHSELAIYTSTNPQPEAVISLPFVAFNNSVYLTFSPSGYFIVGTGCRTVQIACGNPAIFWWNAADGTQVAEWDVPLEIAGRLNFSPDSGLLIMGGRILYDVDTGEVVKILEQGYWYNAVFSADGTFILTHGDPLTTIWTVVP